MSVLATRVVLIVGLVAAVLYAMETYFSDFTGDRGWPGSAAQIIATLLLAVVVEDRVLDRRNLRGATPLKGVAGTLFIWALLALVLCTHAGSQGHALSPLPAALVDGCILGLSGLVVMSALVSMMDQ